MLTVLQFSQTIFRIIDFITILSFQMNVHCIFPFMYVFFNFSVSFSVFSEQIVSISQNLTLSIFCFIAILFQILIVANILKIKLIFYNKFCDLWLYNLGKLIAFFLYLFGRLLWIFYVQNQVFFGLRYLYFFLICRLISLLIVLGKMSLQRSIKKVRAVIPDLFLQLQRKHSVFYN